MTRPNDHNLQAWLEEIDLKEMDIPGAGVPDAGGFGPPTDQPGMPQDPMGTGDQQLTPEQGGDDLSAEEAPEEDISQDPQYPEMPEEEQSEEDDFEEWKIKFLSESKKGDPNLLKDMIENIRDRDLDAQPRKFVEDNIQIQFLRQNPLIYQPSAKIRNLIKQDLDRNLPATSVLRHITSTLEEVPVVSDMFVKLLGAGGGKQDLHRKFIASLTGCVQLGSGGDNEDLVFQETDYQIQISTRFNTKWGDVFLGSWNLYEDDADRFLKDSEVERLTGGSPEERDVLRRRVVIEAIADKYKNRSFIITTVASTGTIYHLGMDLGNCLQSGFLDGRLIVRSEDSDNKEAFIDDDGNVVSIPNMTIYYVREKDEIGSIERETEEIEFIRHDQGQLFLSAQAELLTEAMSTLDGIVFKELPWRGNPTDFMRMSRCVPSADEVLFRRCD
jgi:hypothetical protein